MQVQRHVGGACAGGSSIRAIDQNGGITCETDDAIDSYTVVESSGSFAAGYFHSAFASCPASSQPLGGGYRLSNSATGTGWNATIVAIPYGSYASGTGWLVDVATPNQESIRVIAYAVCAEVP
jgi:hypothetical protein